MSELGLPTLTGLRAGWVQECQAGGQAPIPDLPSGSSSRLMGAHDEGDDTSEERRGDVVMKTANHPAHLHCCLLVSADCV